MSASIATATAGTRSRQILADYFELTKPKVVALITFTAIVGTLLASPGWPPLDALILGNLGIALAAAALDTCKTTAPREPALSHCLHSALQPGNLASVPVRAPAPPGPDPAAW